MKRTLVLTLMALLVAIVGVRPLYAQDFAFSASNKTIPGLTNNGVTGAAKSTGFLNTTLNEGAGVQANLDATFNVRDIAVGDFNADGLMDIIAIANGDPSYSTGEFVLFVGEGDGTFGLPLTVPTFANPQSITAADADLDGITDIAIGEDNGSGGGFIEVFSGFFLTTGTPGLIDANGVSVSGSTVTFLGISTTGGGVKSIEFARINTDAIADIAVVTSTSTVEVADSNAGGSYNSTTTSVGTVSGTVSSGSNRAISSGVSNILDATLTVPVVDSDIDLFVATTNGISVLENETPGNSFTSAFAAPIVLLAGTHPVGVVVDDVNGDNIDDILALNEGSGTLSTFLGNPNAPVFGYQAPRTSLAGANPISLSLMNFNNDGKIDVVVANAPVATSAASFGDVRVLTGTGAGVFNEAREFSLNGSGDAVIDPTSVATGIFDQSSPTDDIVIGNGFEPGISPGGVYYLSAGQGYAPIVLKIITAVSLAADFDGVGGLNDVAVMEQNFGFVVTLLNVSSGAAPNIGVLLLRDLFTNGNVIPTSATAFRDALTGLNDIAVTDIGTPQNNAGFGQIIVGLNDGTGNFLDIRQFRQFVATQGATNVLNGDFNNDGIDDLVYVDFASNFAAVALNDGTNAFLEPQFRETGGFIPVSAAIADVNDDDNLDVVAVNEGGGLTGNQSIVSVLVGAGDGRLVPTGALLQVPNFALSIVGGLADIEANGVRRVVDFNNDGFPDFAVASTRGGLNNVGFILPTVSLILNRPDAPGNFTVASPISLNSDEPGALGTSLQLEDIAGGPGLVSGRGGQNGTPGKPSIGVGLGGANYVMAVADFNADGSPDLIVSGTRVSGGVNFRSTIYLIGNETSGSVRVSRPQRTSPYTLNGLGVADPLSNGGDTFVATATGNFAPLANRVPDTVHISLNGNLWVDSNITSILNHAPILTIRREDLNAPFPGGGRKEIITAGEMAEIPVTGFDPDGDRLTFTLAPTPTGEQPPSFVTIKDNGNNTATVEINSGDINRGPGDAIFRIAVQATDNAQTGPGGRLPLIGREYFTLVVHPNTPPTIGAIPNQTVEAGKTSTINLSITDKEGQTVTTTVKCDKGNFVTANGTTLTIAPQAGDVGTSTCTVTAADTFGLTSTTTFAITVTAPNLPPTIASIQDQTVRAGDSVTVQVSASDPNQGDQLRLSLGTGTPAFVSLSDNGNGTGSIRISPALTETQGGRVTVTVTDQGGLSASTSFNVTVQKSVQILAASYPGKQLFISGIGFGTSGATVSVNGKDVTSRIIGQSDNSITVKGSKKKLNLKSGPNQITVTAGGITSNTFVLNLLAEDGE